MPSSSRQQHPSAGHTHCPLYPESNRQHSAQDGDRSTSMLTRWPSPLLPLTFAVTTTRISRLTKLRMHRGCTCCGSCAGSSKRSVCEGLVRSRKRRERKRGGDCIVHSREGKLRGRSRRENGTCIEKKEKFRTGRILGRWRPAPVSDARVLERARRPGRASWIPGSD